MVIQLSSNGRELNGVSGVERWVVVATDEVDEQSPVARGATLARVQRKDIGLQRCLRFVGRLNVAEESVSYRLSLSQPADCRSEGASKTLSNGCQAKPQST